MNQDFAHLKSASRSFAPIFIFGAVSVVLFIAIAVFAPNYQTGKQTRHDPLGGDFLQEWVGGNLVVSGNHSDLYRGELFRSKQHDAQLLGFSWDSQRYFPAVYPPFYYLLCSPLACLPYKTAMLVWLALMIAALMGALWMLRSVADGRSWVLCFCLCYPVILSLTTGQKGTVLLLILVGTFWLLKHDKPFAAGVVFALIAFKPHLAIPLGLVMLFQRQWRFLSGCAATLTVLIGACLAMGFGICNDYIATCLRMGDYVNSGGYQLGQSFSLWSASQLAVNSTVLNSTVLNSTVMAKLAAIGGCLVVLGALWMLFRDRFEQNTQRGALQFSTVVLGTMLVSPHFYAYDLAMLVLVAVLVICGLIENGGLRTAELILLASLAAILLVTNQLIWFAGQTGISIGVVLACLAFGLLALLSRQKWAAPSPVVAQSASTCDIAGFVSGH